MRICDICGKPAECTHHLIFGIGLRPLADADNLTLNLCDSCHNMATWQVDRIHGNSMAEKLSKMLGQMMFERNYLAQNQEQLEEARTVFMQRYGRSWL